MRALAGAPKTAFSRVCSETPVPRNYRAETTLIPPRSLTFPTGGWDEPEISKYYCSPFMAKLKSGSIFCRDVPTKVFLFSFIFSTRSHWKMLKFRQVLFLNDGLNLPFALRLQIFELVRFARHTGSELTLLFENLSILGRLFGEVATARNAAWETGIQHSSLERTWQ